MKKIVTILLVAVAFSAVAQPKIVAHRGFYKTAGSCENTISSLKNAQKLGVYGVEFDVHKTADGELVVFHDNRLPNGKFVQRSNYEDVAAVALENGHKIPTLREWLKQGKKSPETKLILEMKKHGNKQIETEVCEMIVDMCRKMGVMEQMEFISFSYHACKEFVRLAPKNCVVFVSSSLWTPCDADVAKSEGFGGLSYNLNVFMNRPEIIDNCNKYGIATTLWMVEHEEVVDWAAKHNVTYISTDFPDKMKAYIETKWSAKDNNKSKK